MEQRVSNHLQQLILARINLLLVTVLTKYNRQNHQPQQWQWLHNQQGSQIKAKPHHQLC